MMPLGIGLNQSQKGEPAKLLTHSPVRFSNFLAFTEGTSDIIHEISSAFQEDIQLEKLLWCLLLMAL